MKASKQTDIASFFGGKPKAVGAKSVKTQAEPGSSTEKLAAGEQTEADAKPSKQLKRLRKGGGDAPKQASPLDPGLEDAEEPSAQPTAEPASQPSGSEPSESGLKRKASPACLKQDSKQAEAVERAAAAAIDSEEESEGAELMSESEEEVAKAPVAKKAKKAAGKGAKPTGKVDGVGTGALKAAAEHGSFDLAKLVTWEEGAHVPFAFLAATFEAIAETSARLAITHLLVNAFRAIIATSPGDLLPAVYLCTNRVAPAHEGLELGIGDATLIKALAQATGRKESAVKSEYDACGDLGSVAAASRATQRTMFTPPALSVAGVFRAFKEIAASEGQKSQDRKKGLVVKLLVAAGQAEAGYVLRALQGKLRIGLAEQTVLVALAQAVLLQREGLSGKTEHMADELERGAQILKQVYSECPSYDEVIPALLSAPLADLPATVHFKAGVPVKPMLAKPTTGVGEVLDKFTDAEFTVEWKYDGERAQVHVLEDGTVRIYSRNSEDTTGKYPDVAALFPRTLAPGVRSVVLDCEVVAVDTETRKLQPFQVLSTRARKDVTVGNVKVPVALFPFDILYLNGRVLLREPLTARREALYASLVPVKGELEFAVAKTSRDVEELTQFLDEAVDAGTEGLIVKTLQDSYEPSKRSSHWLKLKKDYLAGVGDTFDVVPVGAWYGRGKRTGVYGSYLLAVYDPEGEEYQTISKIGTGFSEELLKSLAESMKELVVSAPKPYYRYGDTLVPDVWFEPKAVWEVKAADLSISPVHKAALGLVDASKGISIRFPRLVRVRDDKGPEDATSAAQVAEMYGKQAIVQQQAKGGKAVSEDY